MDILIGVLMVVALVLSGILGASLIADDDNLRR